MSKFFHSYFCYLHSLHDYNYKMKKKNIKVTMDNNQEKKLNIHV